MEIFASEPQDIKVVGKKTQLEMVIKRTFVSRKFWATVSTLKPRLLPQHHKVRAYAVTKKF